MIHPVKPTLSGTTYFLQNLGIVFAIISSANFLVCYNGKVFPSAISRTSFNSFLTVVNNLEDTVISLSKNLNKGLPINFSSLSNLFNWPGNISKNTLVLSATSYKNYPLAFYPYYYYESKSAISSTFESWIKARSINIFINF